MTLTVPARLLVVASPTSAPLSTPVPVPTDGQPVRGQCRDCGIRILGMSDGPCPSCDNYRGRMRPDGPFPFTVGRWEEVCELEMEEVQHSGPCKFFVGAVVELVEVVGPSRRLRWDDGTTEWHTPGRTVTRLDEPIPVERPVIRHTTLDPRSFTRPDQFPPGTLAPNPPETSPSFWWADIDEEADR